MRICADCGTEFGERQGKGRPFARCKACRLRPRLRRATGKQVRESTCKDCGVTYSVVRTPDVKHLRGPTRCDPCRAKKVREKQYAWREANPEKWKAVQDRANVKRQSDPEHRRRMREHRMRQSYGMEPEEFRALVDAQDGCCAICRKPPRGRPNGGARLDVTARLHVDHCHNSGSVRGLLCGNCNTMIGLAGEDPAVLAAAIGYLKGSG